MPQPRRTISERRRRARTFRQAYGKRARSLAQPALADEFFGKRAWLQYDRAALSCGRELDLKVSCRACCVKQIVAHAKGREVDRCRFACCRAQAALNLECRKVSKPLAPAESHVVVTALDAANGRIASPMESSDCKADCSPDAVVLASSGSV